MSNMETHPVTSNGVKLQTNLHFFIKCPSCGTKFPAHLEGDEDTLSGICTNCGKAVTAGTPHLAEKMAQKTAAAVEEAIAHGSATEETGDGHHTLELRSGAEAADVQTIRKYAQAINLGAILTSAWGFIYPSPYQLVVTLLVLWPVVALMAVVRSGGVIRLNDRKGSKAPHVAYALLAPILTLAFRMAHLHIADYGLFWMPWAATSLAIIMVFQGLGVGAGESFNTRMLLVPFLAAYGYGVVVAADTQLDQSNPTVYRTTVMSKRVSSSAHGGTSYYFTLAPWGSRNASDEVSISRRLYSNLRPNDPVKIIERPGYFNIPWFVVHAAPRQNP